MNKKISKSILFLIFFAMIACAMAGQAEAQYTLKPGMAMQLSDGYELTAKLIDVSAQKVWFEIAKDGEFVNDEVVSGTCNEVVLYDNSYPGGTVVFDVIKIWKGEVDPQLVTIDNVYASEAIVVDEEPEEYWVEEEPVEEEPAYEQVVEEEELPEDEIAIIDVRSTPSGADVWIIFEGDTTYIGETPIEIPAPVDVTFRLKVEMDGYLPKSDVITTDTDSIYQLNFELEKEAVEEDATISIQTTPAGAEVYMNNVYKGITPLELSIDPGSYRLSLKKDGYNSDTSMQTFSSGESNNLVFSLQEKTPVETPVTVESSAASKTNDDTSNNREPTTKLTNTRSTESDDDKITIEIPGFTGISAICLVGFVGFLLRKRT